MRYKITGADRTTGEDVRVSIEAQTAEEAQAKANRRGILVADCRLHAAKSASLTTTGAVGRGSVVDPSPPPSARSQGAAPVDTDAEPLTWFEIQLLAFPSRLWQWLTGLWSWVTKPRRTVVAEPRADEGSPGAGPANASAIATPSDAMTEQERPPGSSPVGGPPLTRECPCCAETINAKARKCRFCGEMLSEAASASTPSVMEGASVAPDKQNLGQAMAQLLSAIAGLVVCVFIIIVSVNYYSSIKVEASSSTASEALPTLRVVDPSTNQLDTSVTFGGWKVEGYSLSGTAIWAGKERIASLNFTARRGGTVVTRGYVHVPGDGLVRGEATKINVPVWEKITPDMKVTIEVMH